MHRSLLFLASPRYHPRAVLLGSILTLLAANGALAFPGEAPGSASASDEVCAEVVRLLEAGLGEPLVLRWLEESGKRPGRPTADDLVALKKAGASDELVAKLLDRSRDGAKAASASPDGATPAPAAPAAPTGPAAAAPARVAPAADAAAPTTTAAATAPPAASKSATPPATGAPESRPIAGDAAIPSAAPGGQSTVGVTAALRYIHLPDEGEPWDLVIYLDGVPFDPVPAAASARSAATRTHQRSLPAGRHWLAWSQEEHIEDGKGRARHGARFEPEPLAFELAPGAAATIDFEYRDPTGLSLRKSGPVTVSVSQNGRELARRDASGDAAAWPKLCEEIEVNFAGRKPTFLERQDLRYCLRWAALWQGVAEPPTRDAVRPPVK